jgi:phosphate:Na+ symporter
MSAESTTDVVFLLIGGLGLFLFGMRTMSASLHRVAGERMRYVLRIMTHNVLVSVVAGAAVTFLIQSSSATTVMVVGFVNAGLMTLKQAVGVIMGANIGTTVTAWLVSGIGVLEITNYALPAIGVGFLLTVAGKRRWQHWGGVVLGFGLLFFGLALMKEAFGPLRESEAIIRWTARFGRNPVTGVLIGALMTMIIQSSSATIAIAQMLAFNNVLTFAQALPLVFGDNIGTTVTALIASSGTNVNAKRAAWGHVIFNILGVAVLLPFVWTGHYARLVEALVPVGLSRSTVMLHIAVSHTVFNVANTLVFMPMAGVLAWLTTLIVRGEAGVVEVEPKYLEEHLLSTPTIALEQARREVVRMIELAASAEDDASRAFFGDDASHLKQADQKEEAIDNLQNKITQYLIEVSRRELAPSESNELPVLLHSVNDIERIGDHATNLAEAAQRRIEGKLPFSAAAVEELRMMRSEVRAMFETVIRALRDMDDEAAKAAVQCEKRLNAMEKQFRESHLRRLAGGECNFYSGLTFVDCVYNYEKIGDHLLNAAQAVLGDFQWGEKMRAHAASATDGAPERPSAAGA